MTFQDISESIERCAAHYGDDAAAMRNYLLRGQRDAIALPNRGPLRFDEKGVLEQAIRDAYSTYGFYIFENVIGAEELDDIERDLNAMRARFPTEPGSKLAADGGPALDADIAGLGLLWAKPLTDPFGGTELLNGRHQVKMHEPTAESDSPADVPFILVGSLQFSDACLRIYGHPGLLRAAASINGEDFAPFNEVLFIKDPGVGAAVSWHQDGDTHWDSDAFDEGIHGFNFMAQVYGSTAVNGVWVLPGSHKTGRIDIQSLIDSSGSERIDGMLPIICNAGDVVMCNRQLLHGSFANSGLEPRLTINFGFHRRASVLDVMGSGMHSQAEVYDAALIEKRSQVIGWAIDARRQRYPDETPYSYRPFAESGKHYVWDEQARQAIKDYNLHDLSI